MKRRVITIVIAQFVFFLASALPALAGLSEAGTQASNVATDAGFSPDAKLVPIVGTLVNAVLSLVGVIFILLIIKAGITWMTAQGEEAKVKQAQTTIINSIIGLVVTLSAWAIYTFVGSYFGF